MKALVFDKSEWQKVYWPKLLNNHGDGIRISWVCKDRLGFTVREHRLPISDDGHYWEYRYEIHLDFYDEHMRTMFILKYMNNECN